MLDLITDTLHPIIVDLLLTGILVVLGWLASWLPAKWRVDVEARHRAALHSALETGVALALDGVEAVLRTNPAIATLDALAGRVVSYTERSVPDALRRLGPSRGQLQDMARAKLREAIGVPDALATALREAGAR